MWLLNPKLNSNSLATLSFTTLTSLAPADNHLTNCTTLGHHRGKELTHNLLKAQLLRSTSRIALPNQRRGACIAYTILFIPDVLVHHQVKRCVRSVTETIPFTPRHDTKWLILRNISMISLQTKVAPTVSLPTFLSILPCLHWHHP